MLTCRVRLASFPGYRPAFRRLQYGKAYKATKSWAWDWGTRLEFDHWCCPSLVPMLISSYREKEPGYEARCCPMYVVNTCSIFDVRNSIRTLHVSKCGRQYSVFPSS